MIKFLRALIIPAIGILLLILLIFALSDEPVNALYFFFLGPFSGVFNFGNLLNSCVPLILGSLGIIIAMKAGNLNLGGEGQIYLGAFVTTAAALSLSGLGFFGAVLAVGAGIIASGAMSAFSGFLKAKWSVNELISSFLLSCAVIPIVNFLVSNPFLDPETSLISTKKVAQSMRLSYILAPSQLNTGFFIALIMVFLVRFFLARTKKGYELRMTGHNELFARYAGLNTKFITVLSMALSGCLYGLAGAMAVLGTHHAVIREFSSGLGWNALAVALIANASAAAVIPAGIFFAWISAGARSAMQNTGLTFELASVVQGFIFLLSTSVFLKNIFKKGKQIG